MYIEIKKGSLLRNKRTQKLATVISEQFTKLFRDDSDWEAMRQGGGDYGLAATAVRVMFHENGYERVYKVSDLRRTHEVFDGEIIDESR